MPWLRTSIDGPAPSVNRDFHMLLAGGPPAAGKLAAAAVVLPFAVAVARGSRRPLYTLGKRPFPEPPKIGLFRDRIGVFGLERAISGSNVKIGKAKQRAFFRVFSPFCVFFRFLTRFCRLFDLHAAGSICSKVSKIGRQGTKGRRNKGTEDGEIVRVLTKSEAENRPWRYRKGRFWRRAVKMWLRTYDHRRFPRAEKRLIGANACSTRTYVSVGGGGFC